MEVTAPPASALCPIQASWLESLGRALAWYAPPGALRARLRLPADQAAACQALLRAGVAVADGSDLDMVIACQPPTGGPLAADLAHSLRPAGLAFVVLPGGVGFGDPVASWTADPQALHVLATDGLRLVHAWADPRGPGPMTLAVLQKGGTLQQRTLPSAQSPLAYLQQDRHPDDAAERSSGARHYLDVLGDLHRQLAPRRYLEIGIRHGRSLRLAGCPAVAIDPQPEAGPLPATVDLYACTSDDYFFFYPESEASFDLAFIDGMHLSDFALRDFMQAEARMAPGGMIVIDDVLPNHPVQAQRQRQSRVWAGDVWRLGWLLADQRPDLRLVWLDTAPTGLLLISRLDPGNRKLWNRYNSICADWQTTADIPPPDDILSRRIARAPDLASLSQVLDP